MKPALTQMTAREAIERLFHGKYGAARNRAELSQALQVLSHAVKTPTVRQSATTIARQMTACGARPVAGSRSSISAGRFVMAIFLVSPPSLAMDDFARGGTYRRQNARCVSLIVSWSIGILYGSL